MSRTTKQLCRSLTRLSLCALALLCVCLSASAQSGDLSAPTPVIGGEIGGRIAALDVGDARLTRHFYTFGARPGDLELTVETNNLEGDIDLFTAAGMRPLAKVTLYAGLNSTVSRTVFFRRDETIILRVQARASGDADGTYRIRLGGTFAPSTAPVPLENESASGAPVVKSPDRNTRRVNSIGARIEEPKSEVATEPVAPAPAETAPPTTAATTTPATKGRTTPTRRETARRGTTRRGAAQPSPAAGGEKTGPVKSEPTDASASMEPARTEPTHTNTRTNRARTRGARTPRAGTTGAAKSSTTNSAPSSNESAASPSAEPASPGATALGLEAPGSRLVLELRSGDRIVREMSEVRRVAVEGRLIVIVLKNGRVERQPLANVTRMTIEP
jgi:hypothetical protein